MHPVGNILSRLIATRCLVSSVKTVACVHSHLAPAVSTQHELFDTKCSNALSEVVNSFKVIQDFVTEDEEVALMKEVEKVLKRIRYEESHWDDAIHNYRETEHSRWNSSNSAVIERIRQTAFVANARHIKFVHILDVAKDGFIKPHVDSVRFCGDTITGISLLSDSVMRLAREDKKSDFVDVLLKRRSLYIMRGDSRYKYTHEILRDTESYFRDHHIDRDRRISIICRNEPDPALKQ